jgi:hypothetical protein
VAKIWNQFIKQKDLEGGSIARNEILDNQQLPKHPAEPVRSPIRQDFNDINLCPDSFRHMFFELFREHLDLIPLEGKCRAHESKFFSELSRVFIQVERGVSGMFYFLPVLISFPPNSQLEPNTCGTRSDGIRTSTQGRVLTSRNCFKTLGINTLIICGSFWELWVPLELDTRNKDVRHIFIQRGNCHLVLMVDVDGGFRTSATGQRFGTFDLSLEVTT